MRCGPSWSGCGATDGNTPLHAALMGHMDVAELLLANRADVNAKNNYGQTHLVFRRMRADQIRACAARLITAATSL
ncbi:MAG: ankyrin repeat domain-containing protein [Terracidiphilus sp.]